MKNVMSKAWEIARKGQKQFGGKVSEYLSEALRMAWAIIKGEVKEKMEIVALKDWFVRKNFTQHEQFGLIDAEYSIIRETEKAYYLRIRTDYGVIKTWAPKSVCLTQADIDAEEAKEAAAMAKGLERNLQLVAEAKALGIKGIRKGMKTATLEKKIAEFKAAI